MRISVIVPTIAGREEHLNRCMTAYTRTTMDFELIVIPDELTCGIAWNKGLQIAKGAYLHLSADDLVPHEGWWQAAVECVDEGLLPCPLILNPDGSVQSCGPDAHERPFAIWSPLFQAMPQVSSRRSRMTSPSVRAGSTTCSG